MHYFQVLRLAIEETGEHIAFGRYEEAMEANERLKIIQRLGGLNALDFPFIAYCSTKEVAS